MTQAIPQRILYEFNLTCGHEVLVTVDEEYEPIDERGHRTGGVYTCPVCGAEEKP